MSRRDRSNVIHGQRISSTRKTQAPDVRHVFINVVTIKLVVFNFGFFVSAIAKNMPVLLTKFTLMLPEE